MTWFFDSLKGGYWPSRQRSSGHFQTGECFRQHRAIRQEVSDRIFAPIQSLENEGILYVFLVFQTEEVGQKDGGDSQTQLCGGALEEKNNSVRAIMESLSVSADEAMKLLKTPESGRDIIRSLIEQ